MRKITRNLLFVWTLFAAFALCGAKLNAAQSPIAVSQGMALIRGASRLEMMPDAKGEYTFDQVREPSFTGAFQKIEKDSVKDLKGITWFRGVLENPSDQEIVIQFQFYMASHTEMELYQIGNGGDRQFFEAGWKKSFHSREIPSLYPTFEFKLRPGKSQITIRSDGPVFTLNLGSKNAISENSSQFETILTFCLAAYLTLALFNFFVFTRTRDRSYLYYVIRCLSAIGISVVYYGVLMKLVLPNTEFKPHALMSTMTSVDTFCWMFVARRFLSLEKFGNQKIVNGVTYLLGLSLIASAVFPWVFPEQRADALFGIFGPLTFFTGVGAGIAMSLRGYRPAYFFLLASAFNLTGVILIVLALYGPLDPTMFTDLAPCISGVFEGLLLAFGLGDKYMMHMNAANAALNEKNVELDRNLSFMFRKLDQGIFSIDQTGTISNEHSDYLETILENDNLGGKDAFVALFKDSDLTEDEIDQVRNATLVGIGEDLISFDLNSHIFPREMHKTSRGSVQIIEMDWQPLLNQNEKCEKIMVVLRDVSQLRALQTETEKNQRDMKIAAQILAITVQNFRKYAVNAKNLMQTNLKAIVAFEVTKVLDLPLLFRNIHTIKGNARTFGLLYIAEIAHEVENYFSDLRTGKVETPDPVKLAADLQLLINSHAEYEGIIESILKVNPNEDSNDLVEYLNKLYHDNVNEAEIKELFFQFVVKQRATRYFPTLEEMLNPVIDNQSKLAVDLSKPTPRIIFDGHGIRLSVEMEPIIRNIFTQLLRNSIDHGIETPEQRQKMGKVNSGAVTVSINAAVRQKEFVIEVQDDGAGLNLLALDKKAEVANLSDEALAETIFNTGISTAEKVTHISGRGVGMDIVRDLVARHGGKIDVVFTESRTNEGRRPFKLVIRFPSSYLLEDEKKNLTVLRSANVG